MSVEPGGPVVWDEGAERRAMNGTSETSWDEQVTVDWRGERRRVAGGDGRWWREGR